MVMGIACGSDSKNIALPYPDVKKNGDEDPGSGSNPDGAATAGINVGNPGDILGGEPLRVVDAVYRIMVKFAGFSICEGNIKIEVNVDLNNLETGKLLNLPAGWVDCSLLGRIDLTAIMGIFSTKSQMPKIKVDKSIIFIEEFGNATYNPPRPFLPSFLAASKKSLNSLQYSNNITINDTKNNVSGKGTASVRMLGFNTTYNSPLLKKKFSKVMHFQTNTTGFDNMDKVGHFLFEDLQIRMNLSPIVLLSIKTKGQASGMTSFAFENIDKFPPDVQSLLKLIPSKHNPDNFLSPLFGGLADRISRAIDINADLEIAEYIGPTEAPKTKDDGKDKFGDRN